MKSNIRKLRNERNISQTTLAKAIGKTQQAVSHMERDRDRISIESLITLADYFGVSTDCILGLEPHNNEEKPEESSSVKMQEELFMAEAESLKKTVSHGDGRILYQLILYLLLCSLNGQEEELQADVRVTPG